MADKSFSVRLDQQTVLRIVEQFPDFNSPRKESRGRNTEILRTLLDTGLGSDPRQILATEMKSLQELLRDQQTELQAVKRNLSTVLQVILRNISSAPKPVVEETISTLKSTGKLV